MKIQYLTLPRKRFELANQISGGEWEIQIENAQPVMVDWVSGKHIAPKLALLLVTRDRLVSARFAGTQQAGPTRRLVPMNVLRSVRKESGMKEGLSINVLAGAEMILKRLVIGMCIAAKSVAKRLNLFVRFVKRQQRLKSNRRANGAMSAEMKHCL